MRLSELKTGESATIVKVTGHGGFRRRIMEMGFVRGQRVEVLLNAPLKDPIEYKIMGYDISLRRSEADMVVVLSDAEAGEYLAAQRGRGEASGCVRKCGEGTTPCDCSGRGGKPCATVDEVVARSSRTISVALVGNPNSGKTSLFNAVSGGHEHVGNYGGVTVGAKIGYRNYRGYRFEVTDLPGTYALTAYTPEERYVRSHIAEKTPDVVINTVVASNLERNLYLTTELIDINPRMVVALNMYDELERSGAKLDYDSLGRMLGVPMVPVEARNNRGIEALLDTVIDVFENRDDRVRHIHINMGPVIEEGLRRLNGDMSDHREELPKAFPPRYYAMKLLEGDRQAEEMLHGCARYGEWIEIRDRETRRIAEALGEDIETALADQKYGFIQGALRETYIPGQREQAKATALIDAFVTHKLWGFPIFFALMWLMFWCTFSLGAYPQDWLDALVGWIGDGVNSLLPEGPLRDMLSDGVIGQMMEKVVLSPARPRWTDDRIAERCGAWAATGKPSSRGRNIVTSVELDSLVQERFNLKLKAKYDAIRRDEVRFEQTLCDDADYVLVAYGSSARIALKVVEMARADGHRVGLLRPITLFPFPTEAIDGLSRRVKGFLSVEMSTGQMVEDVMLASRFRVPVRHYGRTGGVVHSPGEVYDALKSNFSLQ